MGDLLCDTSVMVQYQESGPKRWKATNRFVRSTVTLRATKTNKP